MKKASDYLFLEHVPSGHLMDVLFINLGHMLINQRPEFGVRDAGSLILIFKEGSYQIFVERDVWFEAGQKVLDYVLKDDTSVAEWEDRMNNWLEYIATLNLTYGVLDFGQLSNYSLCLFLDSIIGFEKTTGMQVADIISNNYGTNLIHKEFEKTLKELGFAAHAIGPILLRTTRTLGVIEYEKALSALALTLLKDKKVSALSRDLIERDKEIKNKIDEIHHDFGWLDASLTNPPKSIATIISDLNDLLSFGNDLERIISEREAEKAKKKTEREEVWNGVMAKASPEQKRIIYFTCKSSELGSVLVDEIMRFIYLRRGIYAEFGKRLSLSETEAKYLLPDELKDALLNKTPIDKKLIENRYALTLCVLENNDFTLYNGDEAEKLKAEFATIMSNDTSPLKGEIAYSGGKVRGIARLVRDVSEMSKVKDGDILVSSRTYPDLLPAMRRAKAIIAELGGLLSHAAIVSRELHIPCVVGVRNAVSKIKDGDEIEIDTETGAISVLSSKIKK